jgi:hypothetical protein
MDEGRRLTAAEAETMLPAGPVIHTFTGLPGGGLGGEDWPRDQVLALLRDATTIRVAADPPRAMGHGLAVFAEWRVTFIETGDRHDELHYAIGTYAAHLAGLAGDAELRAAVAAVPPAQMADYTEITRQLRASRPSQGG